MRTPQSRNALFALIAFVSLVAFIWWRFLDEFPKDGLPPSASPTTMLSPIPGASDETSPMDAPFPYPSPSPSELYPSVENPSDPTPAYRRLDDEFSKVTTRLPIVTEKRKHLPRPPFLLEGCEGESCGFVENLTLTCESKFVSDPHPKGFLAFTLPAGTQLSKARIFTLVKRVGSARLKGEKKNIPVLSYSSDGDWLTWEQGEFGSYSEWRDGNPRRFRAPVRESWVYAEDDESRLGWLKVNPPKEGEKPKNCPFRWGI